MTTRKLRGRRYNNDLVEFGLEDQGRLGKVWIASVSREGRDPFDVITPVSSKLTREESEIRQIVGFFGLKRWTLEVEVDGQWQPLEPETVK